MMYRLSGVARAVYAYSKPVVLLDDPYSALDAATALQLSRFLLETVCRVQRRIVIIVTHTVQLLSHAKCIIMLDEGMERCRGMMMLAINHSMPCSSDLISSDQISE